MAPTALLHCIITLYDLSRPLRLTYCTIISLSPSFIYDRRRLEKWDIQACGKSPEYPKAGELNSKSNHFLSWSGYQIGN